MAREVEGEIWGTGGWRLIPTESETVGMAVGSGGNMICSVWNTMLSRCLWSVQVEILYWATCPGLRMDENIDLGTFKVAIALVYSGSSK